MLQIQARSVSVKSIAMIFTGVIFAFSSLAQNPDIVDLVDSVHSRLQSVSAYTAEATIHVDVDFIEMPDKTATISYEAPDKYDIDSDGFLMIPKVGMKPMMDQLDLSKYQVVDRGTEMINGIDHVVINMIPLARKSQVVLSTIWIDPNKYLITRLETFTKKAGSFIVDLEYDGQVLPSQLTISFEVEGMNIPMKYFGGDAEVDKKSFKEAETNSGTVVVTFHYLELIID
jgi:outer membrane lipoprotein-sorting protein